MEDKDRLGGLKALIQVIAAEHKTRQKVNRLICCSVIAAAILGFATWELFPLDQPWEAVTARLVLFLLIAALISVRFYNFEARQRFHHEMRHDYLALWVRIEQYLNPPGDVDPSEEKRLYSDILKEYQSLGKRESGYSGADGIDVPVIKAKGKASPEAAGAAQPKITTPVS